jgi:hypothetical protein
MRHDQLGHLERREPFRATQTLAAPSNLPALAGESRIDDFGIDVITERAVHGRSFVP